MRLVYITLGWVAGLLVAAYHSDLTAATWGFLALVMVLATALNRGNRPFFLLNVIALALVLAGWRYAASPSSAGITAFNDSGGLTIVGTVTDAPDITDTYALLRVDVQQVRRGGEQTAVDGAVLVRALRNTTATYGDTVQATGFLNSPGRIDDFDYGAYLARRGIYGLLDRAQVTVIETGDGAPLRALLIAARSAAIDHIRAYLPEPQAGFISAILTGDRRGITPELSAAFRDTGAAHLLAISGFNMVIIAGMVYAVLRGLFYGRRWPPVWGTAVIIIVYAIFAGGAPSVLRAALMSSLLFFADGFQRRTFVPASIGLAVIVLTALDPYALWDVGFQLSLCAVLGLAFLVDPLKRMMRGGLSKLGFGAGAERLTALLEGPVIVTLAAQIAVTPLLLLVFGQVSGAFLPVNALIIPVHAYVLAFGWLGLIAFMIPPLSQAALWVAMALASWTLGIVQGFADLNLAMIGFYVAPEWVASFYVLCLGVLMVNATQPDWWLGILRFLRGRAIFTGMLFSAAAILLLMAGLVTSRPAGRLDVWFLDVGGYNAVLIQTPDGAQILIDGGRAPSRLLSAIGGRIPFHDRQIEVVAITSANAIVNAALDDVLNRYRAGLVITNDQPNRSALYADMMANAAHALRDSPASLPYGVRAGYSVTFSDGVTLEVLHPQAEPSILDDLHDVSLVLRVRYGDVSFLITGNATPDAQQAMLEAGVDVGATVLQIPAQGRARTLSADFLRMVAPSAVVVQTDRRRWPESPHPDTLALIAEDVPVFYADQGVTRHFWTDGATLHTTADD
ncbi:MAG: DUF4131 domain-containing protein [Anaerolineaceae bacterium]|nr:MAG: DUF4131 domain-containing protein [Anaerolineaceae bacterium]